MTKEFLKFLILEITIITIIITTTTTTTTTTTIIDLAKKYDNCGRH